MLKFAKQLASKLPSGSREWLQQCWYTSRILSGGFSHNEPEFSLMNRWISRGDLVLDIGANLGIYTKEMSRLVGDAGRVVAFEPVPETFRYLVRNSRHFAYANITFLNIALSESTRFVSMNVPSSPSGIPASARASITEGGAIELISFCLDQIQFPRRVKFVKIDVEGHELQVLEGMRRILREDRPVLVVEGADRQVKSLVESVGYSTQVLKNSPNSIFIPS